MEARRSGMSLRLLGDFLAIFLRFPLWWYSQGLIAAVRYFWEFVRYYTQLLGIVVWMKNFLTPMFGRYDWQSRIISVFMRAVNIVGRGIAMIAMFLFALLFLGAYFVLPVMAMIFACYYATVLLTV